MANSTKTFDVREDAEQEKKGHEVMELLVAAGYFRARIKVCWDLKQDQPVLNCQYSARRSIGSLWTNIKVITLTERSN